MQFNLNECIVRYPNGEMIVMKLCKCTLYEMNFIKVHGADAAILIHSLEENDACELGYRRLGHINVKSVYSLQILW